MADDAPAAERSICFTWGHYFAGREKPGMECFELAQNFFSSLPGGTITNLMIGLATQKFHGLLRALVARVLPTRSRP
jgi:hypothetical protein